MRARQPYCADVARASREPLAATASRVDNWLLVEYTGRWPYDPLDAAAFAGALRERLAAQLTALRPSRLLLVKHRTRRRHRGVHVLVGRTDEGGGAFRMLELDSHEQLLDLDLAAELRGEGDGAGEPVDHPLLLVCTHGTRDRCCARYGQDLHRELLRQAPLEWVWESSHVGGDRFAANVVVLPEGLYYGRVGPDDVPRLLAAHATGDVDLRCYRGRAAYPFAVQAAEIHLRRAASLTGIAEIRLVGARRVAPHRFAVELAAADAGAVHRIEVEAVRGEPTLLTCGSTGPERPWRYLVRSHEERRAA